MVNLSGIIPAMATPMRTDGSLDLRPVKQLADMLIKGGARGLFAAGTMGECAYLTVRERVDISLAAAEASAGRVPVIAGVGAPTTAEVVEACSMLGGCGIDMVSVVLPYYFRLTQEEIFRHFAEIIYKSPVPVMAYNIPKFTINQMEPETARRLWKECGLAGIKDSSGDIGVTRAYIEQTGGDFSVIVGADALILEGLKLGAKAAISAPANVLTNVACEIINRFEKGDVSGSQAAQSDWDEACRAITGFGTFPCNVKQVMAHIAVPVGDARPPALPAAESDLKAAVSRLIEIQGKYSAT